MFKRKLKEPKEITLQKYQPTFTTVDGNVHIGCIYNWADPKAIRCSIPEYLMIDIKSDGYIDDNEDNMYILNNIISIKWNKVDEIKIPDNFDHEYKVYFTNKEVAQKIKEQSK